MMLSIAKVIYSIGGRWMNEYAALGNENNKEN
jgi:hypothetical protein